MLASSAPPGRRTKPLRPRRTYTAPPPLLLLLLMLLLPQCGHMEMIHDLSSCCRAGQTGWHDHDEYYGAFVDDASFTIIPSGRRTCRNGECIAACPRHISATAVEDLCSQRSSCCVDMIQWVVGALCVPGIADARSF